MLNHFRQKQSRSTAIFPIFLMLLLILAGNVSLFPQSNITITEINPDQSTLDATNPNGASGGRVNGLAVASNGRIFYAATEWGGLYKSTDSGLTWTHLGNHLPMATWDVEVDPTNSNKVYATSFYDGRVNSLAGINVSTDGGVSWIHPATASPPIGYSTSASRRNDPSAFGISIDPDNPQNVYIGTNTGLAISNDGGITWRFVDPTPGDAADDIWDVVVHDGGIIDLVGDDGHQRSTDGGGIWTTATGAGLPSGQGRITVSPDESYVLFAVMGTTIYESDDGGGTWPTIITNPAPQGRIPFVVTNQRSGTTFDLWFGDVSLYRATCTTPVSPSTGGAQRCPTNSWTGPFTNSVGGHDDTGDLVFDPTSANNACPMLLACDGGVYYNTQTTSPACQNPTWEQPNITPHSLWLFGMCGANQTGSSSEDLYFGNQDTGTFSTTNAGAANPTWNNIDCCDGFDVSADPNRVLYSLCCWNSGRQTRLFLRNPGMTGGGQINTYPTGNIRGFRPTDNIDSFGADDYVVITTSGVFITNNVTANPIVWTQLGAATTPANVRGIKAAVSGGTPTFFVQSGNGDSLSQDQLWRFVGTAAGGNWQQINPPGGTGGFSIFDVDPNNPNRIFASHLSPGNDPQMILTFDGGTTWTTLTALDNLMNGGGAFRYQNQRGPTNFTNFSGYPQPTLVAFDPNNSDILVAGGADSGIFISIDGGINWILVTDPFNPACVKPNIPHIPRPRFAYFDHSSSSIFRDVVNIYIGSQGRGVWRITFNIPRNVSIMCEFNPEICRAPIIDLGVLILDFYDLPEVIIVDYIPENCLIKFDCPGCGQTTLCPPYYHIFLDEFDIETIDVGLYTGKGDLAPYELFKTDTGVVLSFRPTKELFIEGQIGDYQLVFAQKPDGKPGRHTVKTRLEVSDIPYKPGLIDTKKKPDIQIKLKDEVKITAIQVPTSPLMTYYTQLANLIKSISDRPTSAQKKQLQTRLTNLIKKARANNIVLKTNIKNLFNLWYRHPNEKRNKELTLKALESLKAQLEGK